MIKDEMERAVEAAIEQWLNSPGNELVAYRAAFYFFTVGAEFGRMVNSRIYTETMKQEAQDETN